MASGLREARGKDVRLAIVHWRKEKRERAAAGQRAAFLADATSQRVRVPEPRFGAIGAPDSVIPPEPEPGKIVSRGHL